MITDQDDDEQENSNRTVGDLGWGVRRFPHPIVMITDQKDHDDEMQNISGTGGDIGWWDGIFPHPIVIKYNKVQNIFSTGGELETDQILIG